MDESEEDRARKAAITAMMQFDRDRYFRDEAVQQEYRDILDREEARREAAVAAARPPGRFDEALARFMESKRETESAPTSQATDERSSTRDSKMLQSERRDGGIPTGANEFPRLFPATDRALVKPTLTRFASLGPNIAFGAASVEPVKTIPDPSDQDAMFAKAEAAAARGNEALVMRRDDPARAVADAPEIRAVPTADSPDRPGKIIDARYKAQKGAAIADPQPITRAEAKELAGKLHEAAANDDSLRWFSRNMRVAFGPYAADVLRATFRFEDIDPKLKIAAAKMLLENAPNDQPTKLDSLIGRKPWPSVEAAFHNDLPDWFRPYANPYIDLSGSDGLRIAPEVWRGKSTAFAPKDIEYLWWHPEAAPFFDDKYGSGSAKRALDGVSDWMKGPGRRGDSIRGMGKDDPMLPKVEEKAGPLVMEQILRNEKPPERRGPAFVAVEDKSLNLPHSFQNAGRDPFPGKPPDSLPIEAFARAQINQVRNLSRSRQDIPAALDRTEGTFGAGSKFYKQAVDRRKEEARKEFSKRFLDVAYKLTREDYEKANPGGAMFEDVLASIANTATDPMEAMFTFAGGAPRLVVQGAAKAVGRFAPDAARTISKTVNAPFKGPVGKVVKENVGNAAKEASDAAGADSIQQGLKMFTGEQEEYSPGDAAKAGRNAVVEEGVKEAGKAGYDRTKDRWRVPRKK